MGTQVNSYPFKLVFYQKERSIPVTVLGTDENFFDENAVIVTENIELSLLFQCEDSKAMLYIAGLELLDISKVDNDGNNILHPSTEKRLLFQNYDTHYPLIPGFYPIKVVAFGKSYYSTLQIETKQITRSQWEYMKDELENELTGLAQDFIQNKFGIGHSLIRVVPMKLLNDFELILKHYNKVMIALNDIALKPRYKLKKEYKLTLLTRAKYLDERSLRYQLTHPDKKEIIQAPINVIDYNLLENKWLKMIVATFIDTLNQFNTAVNSSIHSLEEECSQLEIRIAYQKNASIKYAETEKALTTLSQYKEKCRSMKRSFERFYQSYWLKDVSESNGSLFSNILNMDTRYRIVYQLYRKIVSNLFHVGIDNSFSSQWKSTDKLYEIWGYMHICKTLLKLGYQPIAGWLFSYTDNLFVPTLKPGTRVKFKKEDLTLHLIYDQRIPNDEKETDLEYNPLFNLGLHNRPDGRMDVYKENTFIGSLIFDLKYRQLDTLFNGNSNYSKPVIDQLFDYQRQKVSLYIYGDLVPLQKKHQIRPFIVWGIYPSKDSSLKKRSQKHWGGNVHLLRLCPGDDFDFIANELKKEIENMLEEDRLHIKMYGSKNHSIKTS
jgi:hypothetical protein